MDMTAIIITAIICFTVMVVVTTICKAIVEKEEIYQEEMNKRFDFGFGKKEEKNGNSFNDN